LRAQKFAGEKILSARNPDKLVILSLFFYTFFSGFSRKFAERFATVSQRSSFQNRFVDDSSFTSETTRIILEEPA
jgi:hypothetical protein